MILPMIVGNIVLGIAFDLKSLQPGFTHIYEEKDINENKVLIPRTFTRSSYKHIESSSEVSKFLDVSGELSLKMKEGKMSVEGLGSYLLENVDRENTVEILLTVYHETVTETFPSYLKPNVKWMNDPPRKIGTHYVRSITYGGQLIISYQIKAVSSEYMEQIKAAVNANLQTSGSIDGSLAGDLDKINKLLKGKSSTSIRAFATTLFTPPQDLNSTFDLIDRYPSLVEEQGDKRGVPIKMELVPLGTLSPNYLAYLKHDVTRVIMDEALAKYDDLKLAFSKIKDFPIDITEELEEKVNQFIEKLTNAKDKMTDAITGLDLSKEIDVHHFDEAFEAYTAGGYNIPNWYTREFTRLMNLINNVKPLWYPYTRAVTQYIHWGSMNCTLPSSKPLLIGLAASSPAGFGSGGNLQCLTSSDPKFESVNLGSETKVSGLNGLTFLAPGGETGPLFCAHCQLENATSVITVAAQNQCPSGMKLEYSGYLATGSEAIAEPVCIDWNRDDSLEDVYPQDDSSANEMKPMYIKCDTWYEEENYIPCVVCSR